MGQYWYIVNLDKKEYVHPHQIGSGLKLREIAGTTTVAAALAILLAPLPGRDGGDFEQDAMTGRWAGDRIALVGDYSEFADCSAPGWKEAVQLHQAEEDGREFKNISEELCLSIERELGGKFSSDGCKEFVRA